MSAGEEAKPTRQAAHLSRAAFEQRVLADRPWRL